MLRMVVVVLLLVSLAKCQHHNNWTYPLSAPLPDGAMVLICTDWSDTDMSASNDLCSTDATGVMSLAYFSLCSPQGADDRLMAAFQHDVNAIRDGCHFDGHSVVVPQFKLTENAEVILNNYNAQDDQLRKEQTIFFSLQIVGGHVGLPILLIASILLRKPRPDLTFINFCFTWVFSSIAFSIGLYRRGPASVRSNFLPFIHSSQECLAQASLITGAQVMTDTSMCTLIIQIWLNFRGALHGPLGSRHSQGAKFVLLAAPYAALLAFLLPAQLLNLPSRFSELTLGFPGRFYCLLDAETLFLPMYATMLVILVVTLIFDVCIIRILYRRWRNQLMTQSEDKGHIISLSLVLRIVLFCMYRVIIAIAYSVVIARRVMALHRLSGTSYMDFDAVGTDVVPVWIDMLQAATPLVAFLVFGTSNQYLDALMFWRRMRPIIPVIVPTRSNTKNIEPHKADDSSHGVLEITRDPPMMEDHIAV